MLRCPWHNWEFDIRTGKSWFDPRRTKVRAFPAHVEAGKALASDLQKAEAHSGDAAAQTDSATPSMPLDGAAVEGPYRAEIFPVKIDADYELGRKDEERKLAVEAKFKQNPDMGAVLKATHDAKLTHFVRRGSPEVDTTLMILRSSL
jgi:hypothetical protein